VRRRSVSDVDRCVVIRKSPGYICRILFGVQTPVGNETFVVTHDVVCRVVSTAQLPRMRCIRLCRQPGLAEEVHVVKELYSNR
jgi:hypothetical protein